MPPSKAMVWTAPATSTSIVNWSKAVSSLFTNVRVEVAASSRNFSLGLFTRLYSVVSNTWWFPLATATTSPPSPVSTVISPAFSRTSTLTRSSPAPVLIWTVFPSVAAPLWITVTSSMEAPVSTFTLPRWFPAVSTVTVSASFPVSIFASPPWISAMTVLMPSPAFTVTSLAPFSVLTVILSFVSPKLSSALEFDPTSTETSLLKLTVPLYSSSPPRSALSPAVAPAFFTLIHLSFAMTTLFMTTRIPQMVMLPATVV